MSKYEFLRVTKEAKTNIKVAAAKNNKSIIAYMDDHFKVDKDANKNYKSKDWGKGLF